jgi:hypothetical protein
MTVRKKTPGPSSRARRSVDELLEAAKEREARALARFERKNATVQKYETLKKHRDRKLDTRRKIIAGAFALEHMKYDENFASAFTAILDRYVEKGPERLLFGLSAKPRKLGNP